MAGLSAKILRVHIIRKALFSTALPVAGSTAYTHVPVIEGFTYVAEQKRDDAQEASDDGLMGPSTNTVKSGSCSFMTRVWNGASAGFHSTLTAPEKFFCQQLLESAFGAAAGSFAGTTVGAASGAGTTGSVVVTTTTGMDVGAAMIFQGTDTLPELRFVTQVVDATHVKLDRDLTVANNYASGAKIYGSWVLSHTLGEYVQQLDMLIKEDGQNMLMDNGQVSKAGLAGFNAGDGLRWAFEMAFSTWTRSGFNPTTHTDNSGVFAGAPLVAKLATFTLNGVEYCVSNFSLDLGTVKEAIACASGADGLGGWSIVAPQPSGSFQNYWSSTVRGLHDANTAVPVTLWCTNASTNAINTGAAAAAASIAVYLPNCEVTVTNSVQNNQRAQTVAFKGLRPTTTQIASGVTKAIYLSIFGGAAGPLAADLT